MGVTTYNSLRYPELTDAPNAKTAVQNLADDLDSRSLGRLTTTQINALVSPPNGMVVYDSTLDIVKLRSNSTWIELAPRTTTKYLSANQNTTTLTYADITALQFAVTANTVYKFYGVFFVMQNQASQPDYKMNWTLPTAAFSTGGQISASVTNTGTNHDVTINVAALGVSTPGTDVASGVTTFQSDTVASNNTAATGIYLGILSIGATSGTAKLQMAQNSGPIGTVTLAKGSWMTLERLF